MTDLVRYDLTAGTATLTMDDGKANVMTPAMLAALTDALDRAEREAEVVVLTGRPRMFSGGYDLAMFQGPLDEVARTLTAGGELVHRLLSFPLPVVAACTGHAIAQGAFLLLAADVRLGVAGDFRLGLNEVAIGLTIPHYGVEVARHRLTAPGFDRAANTGRLFAPEEAQRLGFLDIVVPAADFDAAVTAEVESLSRIVRSAHAATKLRVRACALAAIRAAVDTEFVG
ncbi:crotonase/enoyl-CoA hydratase family protein [Nocardia sp. 2]|uniref:Crotonase/enoyl-CoA hydratase family protein n=1 Tax=Nocardia acididurans TaxID=2802282 RepID=A0ABS1M843_9NOCA|nr:crotonase/enoyl-CoA hydratase family protein [Nocardia acididurans]MBL1075924.1 crotonase/enoyl-CoA hydratase family protein [Nocardia acididurans]